MADQIMHVTYNIDGAEILRKIEHMLEHQHQILKKLNIMATALEDLKEKLAISDAKIEIIVPAIQGVKTDMAFIKAKLEAAGQGSIDPAGVAELLTIVTAQNDKLAIASDDIAALDAETDSTPQA